MIFQRAFGSYLTLGWQSSKLPLYGRHTTRESTHDVLGMAETASGLGRCADGWHDDRRRRRPSAALLIRGRRPGPVAPRRTILAHLRREGCCPRACLSTSRRSKRGRHSIAPRITRCVKLRLGVSFWTTAALRVAGPRVRELGSRHAFDPLPSRRADQQVPSEAVTPKGGMSARERCGQPCPLRAAAQHPIAARRPQQAGAAA